MSLLDPVTLTCAHCNQAFEGIELWRGIEDLLCGQCSRAAYRTRLEAINASHSFSVVSIGGACPTQAEGMTSDGRPFYFRARHGSWTLERGRRGDRPDYGKWADHSEGVGAGDDSTNGDMADAAVLTILDEYLGTPTSKPTSARWELLSTGSVVADARSRTVAVNVETVHADDMPELLDAMGQACRFLEIDGAWEEPQDVTVGGFADMGRGGVRP